MDIIGRAREREALMRCEASDKSELVCVYGPLRAGKTQLVSQTLSPYMGFRVVGSKQETTREQLRQFGRELKKCGDSNPEPPTTWSEAFRRMYKVVSAMDAPKSPHGKAIIFIDEFPWFCRRESDFLSAFAQFWNRWSMAG